ncbi:MAG: hypothetical protein U1F41_02070 [Burkholderiales bacterium]
MKQREPGDPVPEVVSGVARFGLLSGLQWVVTLFAAMLMLFAAMLLATAWHYGPEVAVRHSQYAKLTSGAQARIVDAWLALDVDVATIRNPDFWRASAFASPCVVVELEGDWGGSRSRAFCGTRLKFNESYDLPFLDTLVPGERFVWRQDERGFAVPEIRMSSAAHAWLETHPADTFMHPKWPAKTALEWLKIELDEPIDAAVAGWSAPQATIDIVFDPANPGVLLPAGLVKSRLAQSPSWIVALLLGAVGAGVWIVAIGLLPAVANFNAIGRALLVVLPLLALPWWADYMPRAIAYFNANVGEMAKEMMGDIDILDRFAATAPQDALFHDGGARLAWRAGDGVYAATFGRMTFGKPAAPMPGDLAVEALARDVTAQLRALPEEERIAMLGALRRDKQRDLTAAGLVFVPFARDVLMRADAGPGERKAARDFLWEWVTSPTVTIDPQAPGFKARKAVMRSLADVPVPEIANMAR